MTQIFLVIQVVFPIRIADLPNTYFRGHGLELAVSIDLAGEAVWRMIRQNQFHDVAAEALDLLGLGENVQIRRNRSVASGYCAPGAILNYGNFNGTDAACTIWLQLGSITERGHMTSSEVSVDESKERIALLEFEQLSVEIRGVLKIEADHEAVGVS